MFYVFARGVPFRNCYLIFSRQNRNVKLKFIKKKKMNFVSNQLDEAKIKR
jgi:hypothetical protein